MRSSPSRPRQENGAHSGERALSERAQRLLNALRLHEAQNFNHALDSAKLLCNESPSAQIGSSAKRTRTRRDENASNGTAQKCDIWRKSLVGVQ